MVDLPQDTEALARRLATARGLSLEEILKIAVEESARAAGLLRGKRRLNVDQMLAVGREIAAMPLRDQRSPEEIMDDLNAA
jgi:hypothetical protein